MATLSETIWVRDRSELDSTVQNLIAQGGQVQSQADDAVTLFLKKKMNVVVLVVGLLLCVLPGLAYLLWYLTADQDQQVTVRIGQPANLGTGGQTHWYDDKPAPAAPATGGSPAPPPAPAPAEAAPVPPGPIESPAPDATAVPPADDPAEG